MKILSASSLAALALGLMLSGSAACAAEGPDRGAQGNQETQHQDAQGDQNGKGDKGDKGDKGHKGDKGDHKGQHKPTVTPQTPTNTNGHQANGRDRNPVTPVNQNGHNDWNHRNNVTPVDQNNANNWNNRKRRNLDLTRWHRNFNAPRRFNVGAYNAPRGYSYRRWGYGQQLPRDYYERNFWLADFLTLGLESPPEGYVWVRYGPDALLVDEETGEIIQVEYNVFYS